MTKHTPGPWKYFYDTEQIWAADGVIGRFEPASGPLAAAAPDLFEALTRAENALAVAASYRPITRGTDGDRIDAALTAARRALAEARGES